MSSGRMRSTLPQVVAGVIPWAGLIANEGRRDGIAIFLDLRARDFDPDWNKAANDSVAVLRASAGRDPYDRCLSDLIGQLSTQSDEFRTRWAQHGPTEPRSHDEATLRLLGSWAATIDQPAVRRDQLCITEAPLGVAPRRPDAPLIKARKNVANLASAINLNIRP